ncbi:MAG: hypothetical protein Q9169_006623 [Polycauliona sp. 2 TL-2023]
MYEHLCNVYNKFTFPDNVTLYCDPSEPFSGTQESRESKLSDFFQLPQDLGWTFKENGDRSLNTGTAGIDCVTQRWLYFEVLAQVFGHLPQYSWEHFVETDPSGVSYITTARLPRYLERWLDSERKSEANARKSRLIRIQQVLDKARMYVSQHCAVPSRKDKPTWEINDVLALSFMILGETLTRALSRIQRKLGFRIEGWCSHDVSSHGWGYSKLMLQKLDDDGWCAKAIHMLQALLRGNSIGLVYLFTLRSSSSKGPDHEQCTATTCKEMEFRQIQRRPEPKPAQYHYCQSKSSDFCSEPEYINGKQQLPPNCETDSDRCRSIDGHRLAQIINRGNIPLLEYRRATRDLRIIEMNQSFDKSYAIFSHVWTDGFGSLDGRNEASVCVLDMFSRMLEKVALQRAGNKSAVPELFWIDTLAIPVEQRYAAQRRRAIKQMHHIYTHAKYTIVLDLSLMRTTIGPGYSNPAMKITMCRWMTRLWTLQEAVLSRNLFFCFSDRIFAMTQLEEMFPEEDSDLQSCIPSLARTYYAGILGDVRPKIHEEFRKNEGWIAQSDFLALVWKAAQWRSTAHAIHETLSLATMLNQDTDEFAKPAQSEEGTEEHQQECDDRMVKLLSRFAAISPCPIPPGMIFLPGPRLSKEGYGWAPRSWLSSHEIDTPDPLSLPDQGHTRLDPARGLEVQFPGFLLHDLGFDRKKLWMREEIYFPIDSTLLEWYRVQPAQDTTHFPRGLGQKFDQQDLAIIVSRIPIVDLKETALFVVVKSFYGGIRYVEILNRVWISRAEDAETVHRWSGKHREGHHEAMSAGERLPLNTKWCVDGPCGSRGQTSSPVIAEEEIKPPKRSQTAVSQITGIKTKMKSWLPSR